MNRQRLAKPFQWCVVVAGAAVCALSVYGFPGSALDVRLLFLVCPTLLIASGVAVPIPRMNMQGKGQITISDTLVFLTLLLYGGEAAVLLAAAEGTASSLRVNKKLLTNLFNASVMALSTFLTAWVLRVCFGSDHVLPRLNTPAALLTGMCVMGLVQYLGNSTVVAAAWALKTSQSIAEVWRKYYLWTSLTYLAGASAALVTAKLMGAFGFYSVLATAPVILVIYVTYRTYLKNVEVMAAAAEAEAEAKAEAEAAAAQAEQARRHIEELSHYISEQERISRELQESKEHFRHAAFHDKLTGLPNRALITDYLRVEIERARKDPAHGFAVLFLDLDRFKNINDSLGHTVGDQLLVTIASRLSACLRPADMVARLGGDEFAVLLVGATQDEAVSVAGRIQEALSQPYNLRGHEVFTTTSIGIAMSEMGYDHPEDILRDADTAMYRAKERGKARCEVFTKSMHINAVTRLQLENDLRRAIERGEFRVHYQPIVSLENDRITGFEALVRWQHPERGLVSPNEFVPVAEETGMIVPIGLWVLRESCRRVRGWQRQSPANAALALSVNLSGRQFTQHDLVAQIERVLGETGFDPAHLRLEITESVVMENAEAAVGMLRQLRALGVKISIDDFGTGYSSLSYLHRLPINTLKVDRSFVQRMGTGDENSELVKTIVTLANNLGLEVVAEGVETNEQRAELLAINCGFAQGYLFSRPLDGEAAGEMLGSRSTREADAAHLPPGQTNVISLAGYLKSA